MKTRKVHAIRIGISTVCNTEYRKQEGVPFFIGKKAMAVFTCKCGSCDVADFRRVRNGKCISCGCLTRDVTLSRNVTHGRSRTKEYVAWTSLKWRCHNPRSSKYKHYGARGIVVCERWLNSFESFLSDMGLAPSASHSIDRVDVNGNYEPNNCRWATKTEQMNNMRKNVFYTFYGLTMSLARWSAISGISANVIRCRIFKGHDVKWSIWAPLGMRRKTTVAP